MAKATEDNSAPLEQFETLPRRILVVYLPLAVFVFVLLFPFYWMAITAVKPDNQLTDYDNYSPFWVVGPTLEHMRYLLFETSYPGWMLNTVIVSVASSAPGATRSRRCGPMRPPIRWTGPGRRTSPPMCGSARWSRPPAPPGPSGPDPRATSCGRSGSRRGPSGSRAAPPTRPSASRATFTA